MANWAQVGLRAVQFLLTLLITALIGNVLADAFAGNPSSINFAIFVAVFSWIALIFGTLAAFMDSIAIPIVLLVLDAFAALFTFIAGVVLAAKLHVHSCGNSAYIHSNSLTNGSNDPKKRCHELQASTAFFWFLFAAYLGSLAITAISGTGSSLGGRGGIRKGGPSMSQV